MPQENGNHTGVRWLEVGGEGGIRIEANGSPIEASVHPYTLDVLDDARHLHELNRLNFLTVNIDGKQRGVGGDVPAIAMLKPQYKIKRGELHSFKFRVIIK
jgi:beta-galactosidase